MENCEICSVRKAHHNQDIKKGIINRLNRIEGQVRGITRMVTKDVYCDDILNQISAVQSALNAAGRILLEAHLKSCVVEQIQAGDTEVIDELMKTLGRLMK